MSISPSPMLIWVSQWSQCFKIRVAQHWGGRRHISGGETVWSTTFRIFPENLREKVSVSTICDEYCSFSAHWTPVVQRATFWCSKQSIDLISHSLKILIYPTLNYIDISFYFPIKRYESHLMEPPFSFSCVLRFWLNHEFGGFWFQGETFLSAIFVKLGKQVPFHVYIHLMSFSSLSHLTHFAS